MIALAPWLAGLPVIVALALLAWTIATTRHNVGLVDIAWPLFMLAGAVAQAIVVPAVDTRAWIVLVLVGLWSSRLAVHLFVRNWSAPEDHRYRVIRNRNEPGFAWKSLYLVFGLQAGLAWLVTAPLAGAIASARPLEAFDAAGAALAAFGLGFEAVADWQLGRFRADPAHAGGVMDQGLWRYTRHPNYFGEWCAWWGFYVIALGAGTGWTIFSPLLMTVLLLKVSGVALLEKDIGTRRPGYIDYAARTNAFIPGPRRAV